MARPLFSWRHAILESDLRPTTRHILLTLSCHMTDTGDSCFPSTRQLAHETGLSERAVITNIQRAKDAGWVRVSAHGMAGRRWKRHEYLIAVPPDLGIGQGTEPASAPSEDGPTDTAVAGEGGAESEALNEVQQHEKARGTEPGSRGTEPNDAEALNQVQSNSTENSTENSTGLVAHASERSHAPARVNGQTPKPKPAGGGWKKKTGKREVPADFTPTDEDRAWVAEHCPLIRGQAVATETERFVNHHRANGNRFKDHHRAWRNWMLKAQDFAARDRHTRGDDRPRRELD